MLLVAETRSNLGGASLDHHKTSLTDVTRLHRDRRGGAGIGSFKLFDIFIIGHGERNGSKVDKLAWPVSVTDVSDNPKTLRR